MIQLFFSLVAAFCLAQGAWLLKKPESPVISQKDSQNPYYSATLEDLETIHSYMKQVSTSRWLTEGYRKAAEKAQTINSLIGYLSVIRYYTAGFSSAQLQVVPAIPQTIQFKIPQFLVKKDGDALIIVWKNPLQKDQLPPIGAHLISCDGRDPMQVYQENVMAFMSNTQDDLSHFLFIDYGNPCIKPLSSCQFKHNDKIYDVSLNWKPIEQHKLLTLLKEIAHKNNTADIFTHSLLSPEHVLRSCSQKILLPSKNAFLCAH